MYILVVNCGLGDTRFICPTYESAAHLLAELPYQYRSYYIHPSNEVLNHCKFVYDFYDPPSGYGQRRCRLTGDPCKLYYNKFSLNCSNYEPIH